MRPETNVNEIKDDRIDALNKLLRGELSAVETYGQALERLRTSTFAADLAECRRSHEERVELLRQQVVRLGGKPADTSGPWGGFAKLVEGGAKLFGEKAAVAALEEGEDHGLKLYRTEVAKLDTVTRDLIERSLMPAQERTHQALSTLKHNFH
jgi:bacterioferritin (cytochrome b1)